MRHSVVFSKIDYEAGAPKDLPRWGWKRTAANADGETFATLALRIRSIGEAVGLEINKTGSGFLPYRALRTAPPMGNPRRSGRHERR